MVDTQQLDELSLKTPPHSLMAEHSILGSLLLENQAFEKISHLLVADDFYHSHNRIIYKQIVTLIDKNAPADIVTVAESLKSQNQLEEVGGMAYLSALVDGIATAANIYHYAEIVYEKSVLRQLIATGSEIAESAYAPNGRNAKELLDIAERKVLELGQDGKHNQNHFLTMREILPEVTERIESLQGMNSDVTGKSTGFTRLDKLTAGLQDGDLIIVAGRPSMGKTAFALNMVEHIVLHEKLPVALFSMEMSAVQLTMRLLSSVSRMDQSLLRTGKFPAEDTPRLGHAMEQLLDSNLLHIDESASLSGFEVRARARRLHRQYDGLGLIVIDYLQLMQSSSNRHQNENRATEISEISRSLKALAKELKVPVIAISQLNRSVDNRHEKTPMLSDLRESGAIEQDADVILFIYRDEVYNKDSQEKGMADIIIGKQRNGPIGRVKLTFLDIARALRITLIPMNTVNILIIS